MRQQYGLRIQSKEFSTMTWDEFADLLCGLNETTPLVRVAQIRTETDPETLKDFTPAQHRMRSDWQRRQALKKDSGQVEKAISNMQQAFANMWGESNGQ